ncbi:AAA family ATPase [Azospirillum formosense]|uniref:AAA family ATPase n=1 Tax=Azospirillum formosense TaxID=861533 RepID=A0ABX2KX04_9PROT|nr:AAA family ATPase [Azospirillum formosense]MBY3757705.1 AAA family ATPase [Azospirillum formosense]NUB18755.1 AAA family ATPase [Azospirillum formosense]
MRITRLSVAKLRAFEQASFEFDPRFTLLVGVNGMGKTTVLDTLRICLSRLLPRFTASKSRPEAFGRDDIQVGASALTVDLDLTIHGEAHHLLIHKQREQSVPHKDGVVREQTLATPDLETLSPGFRKAAKSLKTAKTQPVAVYFATRRSLVSDEQPKSGKASGGQAAAFADALVPRPLRLAELAAWMHAQDAQSRDLPRAGLHLAAMRTAARRFLPDCEGLRAEMEGGPRLLIEKQGCTLDVRYLSDGERSLLALVFDLARRLSQANPGLDDPVRDGVGVVLIDEIDLHLHPQWQRRVVGNLEETFPNCQFIATTHSPQVIGEVAHDKIQMIKDGKIYSPSRSFGIDSSRVLEEVMDTKSRNAGVEDAISNIARLIGDGRADEARAAIQTLSEKIGEDDPEITRARTLLDFIEGDA